MKCERCGNGCSQGRRFCGRSCALAAGREFTRPFRYRPGQAHPNWRGGEKLSHLRHRLRNYQIDPEGYYALLANQGNACAICRKLFERTPHVDHEHGSGVVRGLLCGNCNLLIGHAHENAWKLLAAAAYLKRYQPKLAVGYGN